MATQRYVLLIRGINVGRAKPLSMPVLENLLRRLHLQNCTTYLRSGNAVFDAGATSADQLESLISDALFEAVKFRADCFVRTSDEFTDAYLGNPLSEFVTDAAKMLVIFLPRAVPAELFARFDPRDLDPHHVALRDRAIYQWCPNGVSQSPSVVAFLERNFAVSATARNYNTVQRLVELLAK